MSKITTKDCVTEINKQEKGNWKRVSKNRFMSCSELENVREFKNKDNNKLAFVYSTETEVLKIEITEPITTKEYLENKGLANDVKSLIFYIRGSDYNGNNIESDIEYIEEIIATTIVVETNAWDEKVIERQDFENWEIEKLNTNSIRISHGGDWQPCIEAEYRTMKNGLLYIDYSSVVKYQDEE